MLRHHIFDGPDIGVMDARKFREQWKPALEPGAGGPRTRRDHDYARGERSEVARRQRAVGLHLHAEALQLALIPIEQFGDL